jgi:hypothetical protein
MLGFGARFVGGRSRLLRLADISEDSKKASEIKSLRPRWEASENCLALTFVSSRSQF